METSSSSSATTMNTLLQALSAKGWCFRDVEQVKSLINNQLSLRGNAFTVDSVESELINSDLRSIGGKSLPDSSALRKASYHLQGPKVLQVSSVRDICQSGIAESSGNSKNNRLLRLKLTDGHSEITAIEYSPIPSLSDDVVPGTKVLLENKAVIRYGIVCLNTKSITVLGGIVQSLYEEWQMNRKYSGFSRSSLRQSDESAAEGPPPFEKLQIGARSQQLAQLSRVSQYSRSSSKSLVSAPAGKGESSNSRQMDRLQSHDSAVNNFSNDVKPPAKMERIEEKTISSEGRPKEVVESVPVQNQAAAQKLLQKMTQPSHGFRGSRGQRYRGKDKEEDSQLLTLDEWERRKAGGQLSTTHEVHNVSQDEDLARQLQEQFDLEDIHVQKDFHEAEAENLRMSMFSFERDDSSARGGTGFRGRGRGRGRRGGRRRS